MIKAAVLGSPISHSLSPVIHKRAYEVLNLDWEYERFEVKAGELSDFLNTYGDKFRGFSLTMPLKEEALTLLDAVSDLGKQINAVNTIIFDDLGKRGENTDVQGFIDALSFHEIKIPRVVSILGGGATARAAIAALDKKAQYINVYSRSAYRAKALVNSATSSIVTVHDWSELEIQKERNSSDETYDFAFELVISTTPKGATDGLEPTLKPIVLFESLYDPWPTRFLQKWRDRGGIGIDGLDLLIWQAIGQIELMTFEPELVQASKSELYHQMRDSALQALSL